MSCRGALFALNEGDVEALRALDERARVHHVTDVLEEREQGGPWAAETDKAWDAIQRCFSGGVLAWEGGEYPLNHVILCGESLYTGGDSILSLKTPAQVRDIAAKVGEGRAYANVGEYVRDLIRRDKERVEREAFDRLKAELNLAFAAPESAYQPLAAAQVIARNSI